MLPTTLPTLVPSIPQEELQLPSLQQLDLKRKRKTNVGGLPSLGSLGGRRANKTKGKGLIKSGELGGSISKLVRSENAREKDKRTAGREQQQYPAKGELEELLQIVKTIEEECLLDPEKDKEEDKEQDAFFKCMDTITQVLDETRELIEQRRRILETSGMTYEAINKRSAIEENIKYMKDKFNQLGIIFVEQHKQQKKLQLSDEEMERRHKQLNSLLREIEAVHRLSKGAPQSFDSMEGRPTAAVSLTELMKSSSSSSSSGRPSTGAAAAATAAAAAAAEELSAEDERVLQRWAERDKIFDAKVVEIGKSIDKIAEVAVTIGEHAEQQRERVEKLGEKTQQAAAELQALDNKLKLFMKQQNPTHFCCKLLLLLIVLLLCCFVFSTIYARYLKKA